MANNHTQFYNEIALPLEQLARQRYGWELDMPENTIFSAEAIEKGTFVETMVILLRQSRYYISEESVNAFVHECLMSYGQSLSFEQQKQMFESFTTLVK